jgi:hypothetical protein
MRVSLFVLFFFPDNDTINLNVNLKSRGGKRISNSKFNYCKTEKRHETSVGGPVGVKKRGPSPSFSTPPPPFAFSGLFSAGILAGIAANSKEKR